MNKDNKFNRDVEYYLLREIALRSEFTQLEMAGKIGVSVGKVNYVLSAFVQKGIVKMENFKQSKSKKGYLYLLTPNGIKEKKRITLNFIKRKMKEYESLEQEIGKARQEIGEDVV
ncbi:MarR family EPS-associated transcriptional regulator [Desulfobacula sp.]|uniref:MarR family EPS-associated transcriptional regulator n=1 Tax=Desulfobacula sp. TaxID=2593537 RepID=UPI00261A3505|nr:MarR family EPS-associated transcriptional regulator [Desulfobacula sp.]